MTSLEPFGTVARSKRLIGESIEAYRINQRITAPQVSLITATGENLGVVSLSEALEKARAAELDLVEIAPEVSPPVCKILEFQKFLFAKKKQERKALKGSKKTELKEFKFGPTIGEHDLETKVERAREFLTKNNKVKFTIQFRGRMNTHPEVGEERLNRVLVMLEDVAKVEIEPVKQGNLMSVTLMPRS